MIVQNVMKLLWHSAFFVEQYLYRNGIIPKNCCNVFGNRNKFVCLFVIYMMVYQKNVNDKRTFR